MPAQCGRLRRVFADTSRNAHWVKAGTPGRAERGLITPSDAWEAQCRRGGGLSERHWVHYRHGGDRKSRALRPGRQQVSRNTGSDKETCSLQEAGSSHPVPLSACLFSNALVSNIRASPSSIFFLSFFPFVNISKIFFIVKGNGNRFEGIWISIESVKAFICRFYLLCFFYWTLKTSHSAPPHCLQTLFKSPLECRYLTYLPVHSHSIVWIQDIPHEFLLFCIVQPPENQCFTSTDHWIFLFFFFFFIYIFFSHFVYDNYTKEGNILLTHIYLICYRLPTSMSTILIASVFVVFHIRVFVDTKRFQV